MYSNDNSLKHILSHELVHHFSAPYLITYLKQYADRSKYDGFQERLLSKETIEEDAQYSFDSLTPQEVENISKIEDIYLKVLQLHKEGKVKFNPSPLTDNSEYGLENLLEFVAEAISNPYFAAELSKIDSMYNKKSSMLQDILQAIYKLFGIENNSLLQDVYSLFEDTFFGKDNMYTFGEDISTTEASSSPTSKRGSNSTVTIASQVSEVANSAEGSGIKVNTPAEVQEKINENKEFHRRNCNSIKPR